MPFGFNFGSSKQNQNGSYTGVDNFNQLSNYTQTPTNAPWVTQGAQDLYGGATALGSVDPSTYIAGANPLLRTAANAAGDLNGTPWAYDGATDVTRGIANSKSPDIAAMISRFTDPYTGQVVDATSRDLDRSDNLARQQFDLQNADAFGGSGLSLAKSQTEDALSRARGTTLGGLRSHGYEVGLGGAEAQAQTDLANKQIRLGAGKQLADIADQYGNTQRSNIATQDSAAAPMQAIQQAIASAPLEFQSWLASIFAGSQPGLFQGQTGTEDQTGTEQQSGTTTGKTTGSNFGFGFSGGK